MKTAAKKNPLLTSLIKGNTFEEYDKLFAKAKLSDLETNSAIASVIDSTVCNAGKITSDEVKYLKADLAQLAKAKLSKRYSKIINDLFSYIQANTTLPRSIQQLMA